MPFEPSEKKKTFASHPLQMASDMALESCDGLLDCHHFRKVAGVNGSRVDN